MLIKPNSTQLRAEVIAVRPLPDDPAFEVDVRVIDNVSEPERDLIKPTRDQRLTLYGRRATSVVPGDLVDAEVELLAGPFGERVIYRRLDKAP